MSAPERRIPQWENPTNPESMRWTPLSQTAIVKEANTIVRAATMRMRFISTAIDDKPMYDAAERFLRVRFLK